MWKVSPLTYVVQTLVALVLHEKKVECSHEEYNFFEPPSGLTCQEFAGTYVTDNSGYLLNPNATSNCGYCEYRVGDEYMSTVSVKYSYRWRNFGFMWVYIIFNIVAMCALYYIFRVANVSPLGYLKGKLDGFKQKRDQKKEANQ